MTDPFWTPGLSPALAQAEIADAAARAAVNAGSPPASGAVQPAIPAPDGLAEEAGAHVALDRARRAIAASGAPVTGTDDDLFRGPPAWAEAGSTNTVHHSGIPHYPARRPARVPLPGPGGHGDDREPCASQDIAGILAVLGEPLGLPDDRLPSYTDTPAGMCVTCFCGPVYKGSRCLYCWTLAKTQLAPPPAPDRRDSADSGIPHYPARRPARVPLPGRNHPGPRLVMMVTGWLLLTLAVSQPGAISLSVPGILLLVLGYRGGIRRRR